MTSTVKKDENHLLTNEDLKHLWQLVERKDSGPPWKHMMSRSTPSMHYQAWQRDPEVPDLISISISKSNHLILPSFVDFVDQYTMDFAFFLLSISISISKSNHLISFVDFDFNFKIKSFDFDFVRKRCTRVHDRFHLGR